MCVLNAVNLTCMLHVALLSNPDIKSGYDCGGYPCSRSAVSCDMPSLTTCYRFILCVVQLLKKFSFFGGSCLHRASWVCTQCMCTCNCALYTLTTCKLASSPRPLPVFQRCTRKAGGPGRQNHVTLIRGWDFDITLKKDWALFPSAGLSLCMVVSFKECAFITKIHLE